MVASHHFRKFGNMTPPVYKILAFSPFAEAQYEYAAEADCIETLCDLFRVPGFYEAPVGDHRIEVVELVGGQPHVRQVYFSKFITDGHFEILAARARKYNA